MFIGTITPRTSSVRCPSSGSSKYSSAVSSLGAMAADMGSSVDWLEAVDNLVSSIIAARPDTPTQSRGRATRPKSLLFQQVSNSRCRIGLGIARLEAELLPLPCRLVGGRDELVAVFLFLAQDEQLVGGGERKDAGEVAVLRATGHEIGVAVVREFAEAETIRVHDGFGDGSFFGLGPGQCHPVPRAGQADERDF